MPKFLLALKLVVYKDLVTDFGAVGDGVTNNTTAFLDFRVWARTQSAQVHLTIPPGEYFFDGKAVRRTLFNGISHLTVSAYGATFTCPHQMRLSGGQGFRQEVGYSARVNTIFEGETSAVLKTPAEAALFAVGDWCSLGALELQGVGYPPNLHYNQFVKITAIVGSMLSFTPPAIYIYSDAYPETKISGADYDTGGPATLFLMKGPPPGAPYVEPEEEATQATLPNSWDTFLEIRGLTINNTVDPLVENQTYVQGREVRLIDVTFINIAPVPAMTKTFYALRCSVPDMYIEIDKDCETIDFVDCTLSDVVVQSSSDRVLTFDGTTISGHLNGTAKHTVIRGASVINKFTIGPYGYGNSETVVIEAPAQILELTRPQVVNNLPIEEFANSGGVLTYIGPDMLHFGAPGSLFYIGDTLTFAGPSSLVTAVSGVGPVLQTAFPDPIEPLSLIDPPYFNSTRIVQHACTDVSVGVGVTGCDEIVALAQGPKNIPARSYNHGIGDFTSAAYETDRTLRIWGRLVSLRVNVIQPYVGPSTGVFHIALRFDLPVLDESGSGILFSPTLNAKIAGERLITPTTITGGQSGDDLGAAPGKIVFQEHVTPWLDADLTGVAEEDKPIIEYEILTTPFWT